MQRLLLYLAIALGVPLVGCDEPAEVLPDGAVVAAPHPKPELGGPTGDQVVGQPSGLLISWYEGCANPLEACHSDNYVVDEIVCTDCTVEVSSGDINNAWLDPIGREIPGHQTPPMRLTPHSAGVQELRIVIHSTEHPGETYVETLTATFVVSVAP